MPYHQDDQAGLVLFFSSTSLLSHVYFTLKRLSCPAAFVYTTWKVGGMSDVVLCHVTSCYFALMLHPFRLLPYSTSTFASERRQFSKLLYVRLLYPLSGNAF